METVRKVLDYWETLRAGRKAPYRSELDPRQIDGTLEQLFIIERLNERNIRIRLAGAYLCSLAGMELRGMRPVNLFRTESRAAFEDGLAQMFGQPGVMRLQFEECARDDTSGPAGADMLIMPMLSDFGEVSRGLGVISSRVTALSMPHKLSITKIKVDRIVFDDRQEFESGPLPGFGEAAQTPFSGPSAQPSPRLRTIQGGGRGDGAAAARLRIIDREE